MQKPKIVIRGAPTVRERLEKEYSSDNIFKLGEWIVSTQEDYQTRVTYIGCRNTQYGTIVFKETHEHATIVKHKITPTQKKHTQLLEFLADSDEFREIITAEHIARLVQPKVKHKTVPKELEDRNYRDSFPAVVLESGRVHLPIMPANEFPDWMQHTYMMYPALRSLSGAYHRDVYTLSSTVIGARREQAGIRPLRRGSIDLLEITRSWIMCHPAPPMAYHVFRFNGEYIGSRSFPGMPHDGVCGAFVNEMNMSYPAARNRSRAFPALGLAEVNASTYSAMINSLDIRGNMLERCVEALQLAYSFSGSAIVGSAIQEQIASVINYDNLSAVYAFPFVQTILRASYLDGYGDNSTNIEDMSDVHEIRSRYGR